MEPGGEKKLSHLAPALVDGDLVAARCGVAHPQTRERPGPPDAGLALEEHDPRWWRDPERPIHEAEVFVRRIAHDLGAVKRVRREETLRAEVRAGGGHVEAVDAALELNPPEISVAVFGMREKRPPRGENGRHEAA